MNNKNTNRGKQLPPSTSPRYTDRLGKHLASHVPNLKSDGYTPLNIEDHILPQAMWAWNSIDERNLLHKWSNHVRSSQAFAVNLFAPLSDAALATLIGGVFGPMQSVEKPVFEFEDSADRLCESQSQRPHRTQVDVFLQGTTNSRQRVALLVEVKLSEDDFGTCSAFDNPKNNSKHVCGQSGPFGNDAENCFQLRNHGSGERRQYDQYLNLKSIPVQSIDSGCWYKQSASQPMRNVALASVLSKNDGFVTRYALCAPLLHREMWNHWDRVQQVLPAEKLTALPAEVVASLHETDLYNYLRDRYFLNDDESIDAGDLREVTTWNIVASLDERFDHGLSIIKTHQGDRLYDCISLVDPRPGQVATVIDLNRSGEIRVLRGSKEGFLDRGWSRATQGQLDGVVEELGRLAELQPRRERITSPWTQFARTIELFMRAGESAKWENSYLDSVDGNGFRAQRYDEIHPLHPDQNESQHFIAHP